jgi:hypothetical protein
LPSAKAGKTIVWQQSIAFGRDLPGEPKLPHRLGRTKTRANGLRNNLKSENALAIVFGAKMNLRWQKMRFREIYTKPRDGIHTILTEIG